MSHATCYQAAPAPVGTGVGLRAPHYRELLATRPQIDWLEAHSENFFGDGGQPLAYLEALRAIYPVSLHGVGLSLGSMDPMHTGHLCKLQRLVERIEPCLISEHLSWSSIDGQFFNELLPLPYTEEALAHMAQRVAQVQDQLKRPILIENITAYVTYAHSTIPEWEFLNRLAQTTGCGLLLDINNIYVNSVNHLFDPAAFLHQIDHRHVQEIHLAGFDHAGDVLVDTHGTLVSPAVWSLYADTIHQWGARPTLIEWDNDIPALATLLGEAQQAQEILEHADVRAA